MVKSSMVIKCLCLNFLETDVLSLLMVSETSLSVLCFVMVLLLWKIIYL